MTRVERTEHELVAVMDLGSQYAQLIARRIRENHVYCDFISHTISVEELESLSPKGVVMSGGPANVYAPDAPRCDPRIFRLGIPILGICYGMQLGCFMLGGQVQPGKTREYGRTTCTLDTGSDLFHGLPEVTTVWMSHGDVVEEVSEEFQSIAQTEGCRYAAVRHRQQPFYGVQFHPEVFHTPRGRDIFHNFLFNICGCRGDWQVASFIQEAVERIREKVGNRGVICGLSGGVDSSVTAALVHRAIGDQLTCIFVDHGLLRLGEREQVESTFREHFAMKLVVVDASRRFLSKLAGVVDPEEKRRIIGHEFIDVFKEEAAKLEGVEFLAQGTLFPDVIESVSPRGGPSVTIKSHHNVGGLPEELGFELVEPLRELFKDEVRAIGEELSLPAEIVWRQPFPGPGLAIRIIGDITPERIRIVRHADAIVLEEVRIAGLERKLWLWGAILLPVSSTGVMGDERTYENVVAIRAVESTDAMTADWARLEHDLLGRMANRIVNEVRGVNRVVYDISTKPPSTIEWE